MDNGASCYRRFREDGDAEGLVELIRLYRDALIMYLCTFVRDFSTAEELAEDTFVYLGTKKPKDKGGYAFSTWLYTIARRLALSYLRKAKRRGEYLTENCGEIPQDEITLEESYIREERRITVHRAMRGLKPEYAQILWLVYFERMSVKDAARVMNKSAHNAETLVYRARNALKAKLLEEGFVYEDI
jgi:RNA polymerase sigma-70 factor (ECF subfamily)